MNEDTKESQLDFCPKCKVYFDIITDEVGSYKCPYCKTEHKPSRKTLDEALEQLKTKMRGIK